MNPAKGSPSSAEKNETYEIYFNAAMNLTERQAIQTALHFLQDAKTLSRYNLPKIILATIIKNIMNGHVISADLQKIMDEEGEDLSKIHRAAVQKTNEVLQNQTFFPKDEIPLLAFKKTIFLDVAQRLTQETAEKISNSPAQIETIISELIHLCLWIGMELSKIKFIDSITAENREEITTNLLKQTPINQYQQ